MKKQLIKLTEGDLHRIIKESVKNILKESQWDELTAEINERLSNGEDPNDIFDYVSNFLNGFACVKLNNKWNLINAEGQLLTNKWFDKADIINQYGVTTVYIKGKGYTFLNADGQYITNQWFDECGSFFDGCASVYLKDKGWNFINTRGRLLSNQWFEEVHDFYDGIGAVYINGTWKEIGKNGKIY